VIPVTRDKKIIMATSTSRDPFLSTAAQIKSSLTSLGYSFLFLQQLEAGQRRWAATGETRARFHAEKRLQFSAVELTNSSVEETDEANGTQDSESLQAEIAGLLNRVLDAIDDDDASREDHDAEKPYSSETTRYSPRQRLLMKYSKAPADGSKIRRSLTKIVRLIENGSRAKYDAFLLVEGSGKSYWFATGSLRQMALKGEVIRRDADEEIVEGSLEGDSHVSHGSGRDRADIVSIDSEPTRSGADSDDDDDIEIIGMIDAPPTPPRRSSSSSRSPSHSPSHSSSPSKHCQYFTSFSSRKRQSSSSAKTDGMAVYETDEGSPIAIEPMETMSEISQKRKSSSTTEPEADEPSEKRRKENGSKDELVGDDGDAASPREKQRESSSVKPTKDASEDNGSGGMKPDAGTKDAADDASDESDIEVIGTVAAPPRRSRSSSRSSSRSRSYSRSPTRSRSRSPRGSRSPSPLFSRDFLYSGAPRPPPPDGDKSDVEEEDDEVVKDDSDVEDVTEEATAEQVERENKKKSDSAEETDVSTRPPPGKSGDIECIDVDDED